MTATLHLTPAGQGEHVQLGPDIVTIKAPGAATAGRLLVLEITVPPGGGPPMLHRHDYAEMFYVLHGTFVVNTLENGEGTVHTLALGDTVALPPLLWHTFKNVGSEPGRLLIVHSSGLMEGLVREFGVAIPDPAHLPSVEAPAPHVQEKFLRALNRYMQVLPLGVGGEARNV